ncbi:MAG: hypothetical protein L0271_12215 [Gemmatimonadetes bacterium]|nr:hypothetical protein [Gemmatimonadota bacterium]
MITLGRVVNHPPLGSIVGIVRDSSGGFLVADTAGVYRFDEEGRFSGRLGPQNHDTDAFWWIQGFIRTGNTLAVFDERRAQLVLLSLAGDRLGSQPIPSRPEAVFPLGDGRVIAASPMDMHDGVRHHLEVLAKDGRRDRLIPSAPDLPDLATRARRGPRLNRSRNGFWVAWRGEYRVERYSVDGDFEQVITRDVRWFAGSTTSSSYPRPGVPPAPRLEGIHEDAAGRLWTLTWIADPGWVDAGHFRRARLVEGTHLFVGQLEHYYDTVIEVLDGESGRLIAQGRFDELITHFVDDGMVVVLEHDDSNRPNIGISRIRLVM